MIRDKQVDHINDKLSAVDKTQAYLDAFRKDEPILYSLMKSHANRAVQDLARSGHHMQPEEILTFHDHVCLPYIFMWMLYSENRDLLVEKISSFDMFQQFIEGKGTDNQYLYSTKGLDPESTLYKAKQAKQTMDLELVRKALLPLVAEDVGSGAADRKTLKKAGDLNDRTKRKPKTSTSRTKSNR